MMSAERYVQKPVSGFRGGSHISWLDGFMIKDPED
jgi:hypothetical protein